MVAVDLYESDIEKYSVDNWQDIVAISVGKDHIVGLKSDGSVLCTWPNVNGQCNTEDWSDVAEIAAGDGCTGAIKKDGTLLFTGKGINNFKGGKILKKQRLSVDFLGVFFVLDEERWGGGV